MLKDSPSLKVTIEEGIYTLAINRPDSLNALNTEVLTALNDALNALSKLTYEACRVVVFTGVGEKAFIAGADIKLMERAAPDEVKKFVTLGAGVMRQIELLPFPTLAKVNGYAIGGGLELALACDLIIASTKAKLGQAEINLGLIPGFGGTQRLALRTGVGVAKRLIFLGDSITPEEALSLGLIDWCVGSEELDRKTYEIAAMLKAKAPLALAAAKRTIDSQFESQKLRGLEAEASAFVKLFEYTDTREGLKAFIEKKKAYVPGPVEV